MKRIIVSAICVVMCCILICQPVAAAQGQTNFLADSMILTKLVRFNSDLSQNAVVDKNVAGVKLSDNYYNFATSFSLSLGTYGYGAIFDMVGSWDNDPGDNNIIYLTFRFSYNNDVNINFDRLFTVPMSLTIYDNTGNSIVLSDAAIAEETDTSYLLTFMQNISDIDTFNVVKDAVKYSVLAPIESVDNTDYGGDVTEISDINVNIYFEVTYQLPDVNYDALILESVDQSNVLLNEVISNQDEALEQIIATREVIEANGEKLQEISNKQDTIITELEQLPDALRDLDLGTVETAAIPQDELDELAGIEDELYNYSDSKIQYVDQSIDQLNITLNSHLGNVGTAHGLFFTRLFEIDFIRDIVYISLGFGLVAFILRMGRKIS